MSIWSTLYERPIVNVSTGWAGKTARSRILATALSALPRYMRFVFKSGPAGLDIQAATIGYGTTGTYAYAAAPSPLTFGGEASVVVPPNTEVFSDAVDMLPYSLATSGRRIVVSAYTGEYGEYQTIADNNNGLTGQATGNLVNQVASTGFVNLANVNSALVRIEGSDYAVEPEPIEGTPDMRFWRLECVLWGAAGYSGTSGLSFFGMDDNVNGLVGTLTVDRSIQAGSLTGILNPTTGTSAHIQFEGTNVTNFDLDLGAGNETWLQRVRMWPNRDLASRSPIMIRLLCRNDVADSWELAAILQRKEGAAYVVGTPIDYVIPATIDAGRYWALANFSGSSSVGELQFLDAADTDLTTGKTAYASSNYSSGEDAPKAIDDNDNTQWSSASGALNFLAVDFGTDVSPVAVSVQSRNDSTYWVQTPYNFIVGVGSEENAFRIAKYVIETVNPYTGPVQKVTYPLAPPPPDPVEQSFATSWNVDAAYSPITVGIDIAWNVAAAYAPVVAEFGTAWNVAASYAPVSQSFPTTWNVEEPMSVTAEFETSWNVAAAIIPVSASYSTQWDIETDTGEIAVGFAIAWNVDNSFASLDRMIVPDYPVIETWTYQTSVFRSENGNEQRRARVVRPVITQQFTAPSFEDVDFWTTRKVMEIDTAGYYPIPMFQYYDFLAQPAAKGETRLYFSPARVNLVNEQYVALLSDHGGAVLAKVDEIHADGVTLATPLPFDVDTGYCACPVLFSRLSQNGTTDHSPVHAYTDFSFVSSDRQLDFVRPGNAVTLKMLDEYPLIDQYIRNNDEVREAYLGGNVVIDNARANPVTFNNEPTRRSFEIVYLANRELSPVYLDYWRKFFDTVKGGAKPFAVPTFRPDANTVAPVVAGDEVITLAGRDFFDVFTQGGYVGLAFGVQSLAPECTRVLSVALVDGDSVCELAAPIVGTGYEVASFVMLMRAGDQIILTHDDVSTVLNFDVQMVRA